MDSETCTEGLKRLLQRMTAAGMTPDIDQLDSSEQRAVYCALRHRLASSQPQSQPTQDVKDEAY